LMTISITKQVKIGSTGFTWWRESYGGCFKSQYSLKNQI
jgi:hypothetical protein